MPDSELRTRVSLDAEDAQRQVESLSDKASDVRLKEVAAQQAMIRELSTLSIDEYDKQIKAQESLLEQLNLKHAAASDEERTRIIAEYDERKRDFDDRLKLLDEEDKNIRAKHAERLAELEQLKQSDVDSAEKRKEIEKEIVSLTEEGRTNYLKKNELAYESEKDRLETLQQMAARVRETITTGSEIETPAGKGTLGTLGSLPGTLNQAGASLQGALSPILRILGPIGIAFSIEQVVEKLFKANAELRVIRNNYTEIAATMGDLVPLGGDMFVGKLTGAMSQLQRSMMLEFKDALDPKIFPTLAGIIYKGGFEEPEKTVPDLTRSAILMGAGAGVSPAAIAGLYTQLSREFAFRPEQLEETVALLIKTAQGLKIPFEDLSKWTIGLSEQTRIYGYDLADSRRIVTAFAKELENGTVQIGDLVKVQLSLAGSSTQQQMGLLAFLPEISKQMGKGPGGKTFEEMVTAIGDMSEQSQFLRYLLQDMLPIQVREDVRTGPQAEAYGAAFNLETGEAKQDWRNQILRAIPEAMHERAGQMGGGGAGTEFMMTEALIRMIVPALVDLPIRKQNEIWEEIRKGTFKDVDFEHIKTTAVATSEIVGSTKTAADALKEAGRGVLHDRESLAGGVKVGLDLWWQDTAEGFALMMRRAIGTDAKDIAAWNYSRQGESFLTTTSNVLGPNFVERKDEVTPAQLTRLGQALVQTAGGKATDLAEAKLFLTDVIEEMVNQGRLKYIKYAESYETATDIMNKAAGFNVEREARKEVTGGSFLESPFMPGSAWKVFRPSDTEPPKGTPASPEAITDMTVHRQAENIAQLLAKQIESGQILKDIDTTRAGMQFNFGGIQISLTNVPDEETLRRLAVEAFDTQFSNEVIPQLIPELRRMQDSGGAR